MILYEIIVISKFMILCDIQLSGIKRLFSYWVEAAGSCLTLGTVI